jgi:hypothetical protein
MKQAELSRKQPKTINRKTVTRMQSKNDTDPQEWKTVYEDEIRKIQARGPERRAIATSTGKIIIEYDLAGNTSE